MASCSHSVVLFLLTTVVSPTHSQSISVGNNIFESLDDLGCTQFKQIIQAAGVENYYRSSQPITVFVFNDTSYERLPPSRMGTLYTETNDYERGPHEYVSSFTLPQALETTSFSINTPYESNSVYNRKLFLLQKRLRVGDVASGQLGQERFFCNGAAITRQNIAAGQHIIHIMDQVPDMPLKDNALAYVMGSNRRNVAYEFYRLLMEPLRNQQQPEGEYTFNNQVQQVLKGSVEPTRQMTFFLPTNEAIQKIPKEKITSLLGNSNLLLQIITLHIIPNKVIYTTTVNHNEPFVSQMNSGRVIFRKHYKREAVYVTGALNNGDTVTARISPANITIQNGVIHHIDGILGFVYLTALEEIQRDPLTSNFFTLLSSARADLRNYVSDSTGITLFVPTNEAMQAIVNVDQNYETNVMLINKIVEMSLLEKGKPFSLTGYPSAYESLIEVVSRYNRQRIKVYNEGNDTWVEGGYVRARVIKPDIGVLNGMIHQIDAVFGVPTRDIPYLIYCEDRLYSTYQWLVMTGLDEYMRDPELVANQECIHRTPGGFTGGGSVQNRPRTRSEYASSGYSQRMCGHGTYRCEFTFFVPNGTAVDNFARTSYGRQILQEPQRMRWLFRRLITTRKVIYIDQLSMGAQEGYIADNRDYLTVYTDSNSNLPSSQRRAFIMFNGIRAEIIHTDLGGTNGVIHIINSIPFTSDDLTRDVSKAMVLSTPFLLILSVILLGSLLQRLQWM